MGGPDGGYGWAVEAWAGPDSFEEALTRAASGDERAFSTLWRWANPSLLRWLRVVAPDGGEDLASEVWVSVVRALDSFQGGEPEFRAWFFTIARRRAIDSGRRRRRRPQVVGLEGIDAPVPTDMSETLAGEAAVEAAIALLRQLRPDQAEVVALRVIGGLTVAETAAVVSRSDTAVRVLCHRGLRTLAACFTTDLAARGSA
jgi:RNA polymerase sigma-70 factor (ECF subfamily)